MPERSPKPEAPRGFGKLGGCLFSAAILGSMALLATVLVSECGAGGDALERYLASVRAGAPVSESVGGAEAAALTDAIRASRSHSIDNFMGQAGTACYWLDLDLPSGSTPARFLLADRGEEMQVVGASLVRECSCPDPDFERPCHLR